ncbi:MAG TPA: adenylate/guanylate cyclase domain-containing protein [Candidatus Methylomirabilis sp.]|nr:adenylate/guanylate cyclase domain-containing protein [Candidatus Methylomirabilis sp.]
MAVNAWQSSGTWIQRPPVFDPPVGELVIELDSVDRAQGSACPRSDRDGVRDVSVLMADLRGFTAFCERVPPERVSSVLNDYLAVIAEAIVHQRGWVQDFVGDGVLGVFGAPADDPDHAWHAALSALGMQRGIRQLGERRRRGGAEVFGLGVAVHSGKGFVGAIGSARLRKYAVVGDTVNTVARLEELNRVLSTDVLVSGDTAARLGGLVETRAKGFFHLRGRTCAVEVFELSGVRAAPLTA